ncbi:hypothetical protein BaRGS_00016654, partial [Batillaria attramentaria]
TEELRALAWLQDVEGNYRYPGIRPDCQKPVEGKQPSGTATSSSVVHLFSNDTEQPDETGVHVMFGGNVLSGLWFSSLMSPGSPRSSTTAENMCTDVQERDLLTSTSTSVYHLVVAASWFFMP